MGIIEKWEELKLHNENKRKNGNKKVTKSSGDIFFEEGAKMNKDRVFPEDFDFELEEVIYNDATKGDFSKLISKDYAFELVNAGILYPTQIISIKFGGKNEEDNNTLLTKKAYEEKTKLEDKLTKLINEGKNISVTFEVNSATTSIVPLSIKYIFKGDVNFEEEIVNWVLK